VVSGEWLVARGDKAKTLPPLGASAAADLLGIAILTGLGPLDWARDLRQRRRERREDFPFWNWLLFDSPLDSIRDFPQCTLAGRDVAVNGTLGSE
jgi:hypothetical protein